MTMYRPPESGYRRMTGDDGPARLSNVRVEALGSAYQLAQQGIRSEGEEAVRAFEHGEIVHAETGDYISRLATVTTFEDSYSTTVTEYVVSGADEYRLRVEEDDDPGIHMGDEPPSAYSEPSAEVPYTDISHEEPYHEPESPYAYSEPLPEEVAPVEREVYVPYVPYEEPTYYYEEPSWYEEPSVGYDPESGAAAPPGWTPEESDPYEYY